MSDTQLYYLLLSCLICLMGVGECLLGILIASADPPTVPEEMSSVREVHGAYLITGVAFAFIVCAVAALGLRAERQGLAVMAIAALVFCGWSCVRVAFAAGGLPRPTKALLEHGTVSIVLAIGAGALGLALLAA